MDKYAIDFTRKARVATRKWLDFVLKVSQENLSQNSFANTVLFFVFFGHWLELALLWMSRAEVKIDESELAVALPCS